MSERLPALRPAQVVRALERAGWRTARQRGSHLVMVKPDAGILVIPIHTRDVPRGTLRGVLADAGLSVEEFLSML